MFEDIKYLLTAMGVIPEKPKPEWKELTIVKQQWKHITTTDTRIIFGYEWDPEDLKYLTTAAIPLWCWREGRSIKISKRTTTADGCKHLFYEEA